MEPCQIVNGGTAKVSVDVTNTGTREGDEVPQLYVHEKVAPVTWPVMRLEDFQRITLKPGEKKTVEFTVTPDKLSMLDTDMHKVVEPGDFELMVGPSSAETKTVLLHVTGPNGDTGAASEPSAGHQQSLVSDFDEGKISAQYGHWMTTTDEQMGGKSVASMKVVDGGADGSKGALEVSGETVPGAQFLWGGTMFVPGASPEEPVNISSKKEVSFWAKGDGKSYAFAISTQSGQGQMPAMQAFTAGPEWKHYSFPISSFQTDGHDVTGLIFAFGQQEGKFDFDIDQVEIK